MTILSIVNPINERALEYKALALTKLGGYIDAIEICEQLLKIRPNDEIYLNKKACLLSMVNRNQESITLCDEILKIYPENTDAQATKNSVLNHIKKLQELTEYANENREVFFPASIQKTNNQKNNDFTEFKKLGSNDIALYWKAIKLGNDNKYQEALEIFNKILVTNPDNTEVKNCRDIVLKKLGKKELF